VTENPVCADCAEPIEYRALDYNGQTFHPRCFDLLYRTLTGYELSEYQQPSCGCCGPDVVRYGPYTTLEQAQARAAHRAFTPALDWRHYAGTYYQEWTAKDPHAWYVSYSIEMTDEKDDDK
jgi:hypothetical protein